MKNNLVVVNRIEMDLYSILEGERVKDVIEKLREYDQDAIFEHVYRDGYFEFDILSTRPETTSEYQKRVSTEKESLDAELELEEKYRRLTST